MRRSSVANNSAAVRQSALCSGSVETDGIRNRAFSSSRNRALFWRAKTTACEDILVVPFESFNIGKYRRLDRPGAGPDTAANLVAGNGGIDLDRPGVDASAQRLHLFKALVAQSPL